MEGTEERPGSEAPADIPDPLPVTPTAPAEPVPADPVQPAPAPAPAPPPSDSAAPASPQSEDPTQYPPEEPNPPAAAHPSPKPRQRKAKETRKVTDRAARDLTEYVQYPALEVDLHTLRLDLDQSQGQIRACNPKLVQAKYEQLLVNQPMALVQVAVWRPKKNGTSPPHFRDRCCFGCTCNCLTTCAIAIMFTSIEKGFMFHVPQGVVESNLQVSAIGSCAIAIFGSIGPIFLSRDSRMRQFS